MTATGLYVQFGCGLSAPPSWRNFDASPSLRLGRLPVAGPFIRRAAGLPDFPRNVEFGDIVRGLPVASGSCAGVYASHVLEHLSLAEFRTAIRNVHRYLAPNGVFRLVVPDLRYLAEQYVADRSPDSAPAFMRNTCLGVESRHRGVNGVARAALGNNNHLWMWDFESMTAELADAGFRDVRRAAIGDNPEVRFTEVEDPGRWERSLGIEARP